MYPHIKDLGLYPGQPEVLRIISENDGITQVELSHLTNREAATVTRAIQRLESNNLIIRELDPLDKRKIHLYISDKGKSMIAKIKALMEESTQFLSSELTDEEIEFLIGILEKIQNKFNNERDE
jgi:DNA-binding MarR family transcriptional regulator